MVALLVFVMAESSAKSIEITSWLVSAYYFYSQQVNKNRSSEPTMKLFVNFISTSYAP